MALVYGVRNPVTRNTPRSASVAARNSGIDAYPRGDPSKERDAAIEARNTSNARPVAPEGKEEKSLCTLVSLPL